MDAIIRKYMSGDCDAMAIALSVHLELPVVALHPVHVGRDGQRRVDPDLLHACVRLDSGLYMDVRGAREFEDIVAELRDIMELVRRPEDSMIEVETVIYDDAADFVAEAKVDASRAPRAFSDACEIMPELGDDWGLSLTMRELESLAEDGSLSM
ncbi:hypothetical protein G6L37_00985 [Agrobacterium rubi]|nr:hypothetical protein [Agrobacterium rubi]NTF23966.1 hypothetical protein [Agrobacterium rubi]